MSTVSGDIARIRKVALITLITLTTARGADVRNSSTPSKCNDGHCTSCRNKDIMVSVSYCQQDVCFVVDSYKDKVICSRTALRIVLYTYRHEACGEKAEPTNASFAGCLAYKRPLSSANLIAVVPFADLLLCVRFGRRAGTPAAIQRVKIHRECQVTRPLLL